jgi:hypothetical protein
MTAPLISAAFAASIVTCFAPEQNCAELAIRAIDAAAHYAVAAAGFPVCIGARLRIAREKGLAIDRQTTIMGRYNLSAGAARNSEDLNVVTSPEVAVAYGEALAGPAGVSIRFGDTSERCGR